MKNNRRQFIKMAGAGLVGLSINPLFSKAADLWVAADGWHFPRATPESQGVSSQAIRNFLAAANASGISWHSFMLVRHGKVIAEGWWKPYESDLVHTLYSLSKSFTSTAIGLLVKEGKLDVHAPVVSFFPDDLPANISGNMKKMTVRSMLTMNTGHGEDTMPKMRASKDSWVRTYLAQPVEFEPGTHFLYNTGNTYMLGAIVHKLTGQTLEQYLAPRLFQPLGFTGYDWEVSPQGLNTAGYGLRIKTEDIAKLGQLYLQKGKWKDTEILTPQWVDEATSKQTESQVNNGDWSQGYGYQFWRCTHNLFRGDGAFGQFCIVMPEQDAVLAVTGQSPDMQKSMNIIWDNLLPGIGSSAMNENSSELAALKMDIAGLGLPVAKGMGARAGVSGRAAKYNGRKWTVAENELGIQGLQLTFSGKDCKLSVETTTGKREMVFGWEKWISNGPRELYVFRSGDMTPMPTRIAGTATWVDDQTLQLNARFIEAIFGDRITFVFGGGAAATGGDTMAINFLNSVAETALKKTPDPRKPLTATIS